MGQGRGMSVQMCELGLDCKLQDCPRIHGRQSASQILVWARDADPHPKRGYRVCVHALVGTCRQGDECGFVHFEDIRPLKKRQITALLQLLERL